MSLTRRMSYRAFNLINITNFSLTDPRFGLVTAAEAQLPNANVLAVSRFQRNGAPIIAQIASGNGDPTLGDNPVYPAYNYPNSYQTGREIRIGLKFVF